MIIQKLGMGSTFEDALATAKKMLNAPEGVEIKSEVIQQGSKGFLGLFGAKNWQVIASYDDADIKPAKKKAPHKKQAAQKPERKETPKKEEPKKEAAEQKREFPKSVDLDYAKSYLMTILEGLKVSEPKIEAAYAEGVITIDLECDDYGIVIGHRGETLDSIQYLMSLVMKKNRTEYIRVVINVGNYREKRNETLKHLAQKNSSYVLRTGRRYTFEPMNPYERRIIHTAVQEIEGVESRSIGYNQDRRVVIEPVGGVKKNSGGYRRGSNNRKKAVTKAPENHVPKADRADLPKFGKIEVKKD